MSSSVLTPRNLLVLVLAGGVYVLAYRHGQLSAPRPACDFMEDQLNAIQEREDSLQARDVMARRMEEGVREINQIYARYAPTRQEPHERNATRQRDARTS